MKNKQLLERLDRAVREAPVGLLDTIAAQPVDKMDRHDRFTAQEDVRPLQRAQSRILALGTAAAVFLVALFGWYLPYMSVDGTVYLDVNPGVGMQVNRNDQVVRLQALNGEGQGLIDGLSYKKGQDLYELTGALLEALERDGYLHRTDDVMLVSVMHEDLSRGTEQLHEITEVIDSYLATRQLNPVVLGQYGKPSSTLDDYATRYQVSAGKINFIRNLMILNPEFELDELVFLSLQELIGLSDRTGLNLDRILDEVRRTGDTQSPDPDTGAGEPADQPGSLIGRERAISIAREFIGGGTVVEFELDWDDGRPEYEIVIVRDGVEHAFDIDGYTGRIVEYQRERADDVRPEEGANELIGQQRAITIAREFIGGGGTVTEFELDWDDSRPEYDIVIVRDGVEHAFDIDGYTGHIVEYQQERADDVRPAEGANELIGRQRAIAIAREFIGGGGTVTEFELDWDDGRPEYEIEIIKDGVEYEFTIDGYTGRILEFDED